MPSRKEKCRFFLQPMLMNVGDLIADMQREDPGVAASVFSQGESVRDDILDPDQPAAMWLTGCGRAAA